MHDSTTMPDVFLLGLFRLTGYFQRAGKTRTSVVMLLLICLTALTDWRAGTEVSTGLLYVIPLAVGATVFGVTTLTTLSGFCALLGTVFYHPNSDLQTTLHFLFALTANLCAAMLAHTVIRDRRLSKGVIAPQESRMGLPSIHNDRLLEILDTSSAAVITVNERGIVAAANCAADVLFGCSAAERLCGHEISDYLPALSNVLRISKGSAPIHSSAQCHGKKRNGEIFLAHVWYSIHRPDAEKQLAAIVVDSSEEMRDLEQQQLLEVAAANRVAAAAVSHEIRNFSGAIALLYADLQANPQFCSDQRFQNLGNLVQSLERIASMELHDSIQEELEAVSLRQVLNDLRVLVDQDWKQCAGTVQWFMPETVPAVLGHRHGLLQVFLNLAQNSRRAVQDSLGKELSIEVQDAGSRVFVRFCDSGPGVSEPHRLFQPFESGMGGTGMGLYVSRGILRHYGGDLTYESQAPGACFVVELEVA